MDNNHKGIIGGFYIRSNDFKTTKDGIANFKGTYIDAQNSNGSSFGGYFVICDYIENSTIEYDDIDNL